ncbi:hypothetical protein EXY23_15060 [Roseicella aquatilis]|uniref:Uncharacterized protein n=1 Tax=Roseicella aquatilis TaxID=2527868 RepID=A0A4R4DK42_9PROT|nr:hypothetical protein EXY23_15060 [Roseicella aquatilis]
MHWDQPGSRRCRGPAAAPSSRASTACASPVLQRPPGPTPRGRRGRYESKPYSRSTEPASPGRSGRKRGAGGRVRALPERKRKGTMRGILLWVLGIPIPIIILLYLFNIL